MKSATFQSETQLLTVAVLGTGSIGERHLSILSSLAGVQPMAVPKRAVRVSELRRKGIKAGTLAEAVSQNSTLGVIASSTGEHVADSRVALKEGLHLLVEKPMASDANGARQILDAAIQAKRQVFVGCVLRFSDSLNVFKEWLPQIGKVHSVQVECRSYLPDWRPDRPYKESYSARKGEGGVLLDLIHEIDYTSWIFGWPAALQASLRNTGQLDIKSEEAADMSWDLPGGTHVSMSLDYLTRPTRRLMQASGEHGTLEWNGVTQTTTLRLAGKEAKEFQSRQSRDDRFSAQAREFIQAVQGQEAAHLAKGEDGFRALAICDAARRADHSKKEERVLYS